MEPVVRRGSRALVLVSGLAGLAIALAGCTAVTSRQTSSPEASASAPVTTPSESPSPDSTPPVLASPSSIATPLAKLIITSLPFHVGEVGIAYATVTLGAMGGKPPYTWTANSGTLPTGLALSSDGKVTGTPSVAGAFSFVVQVDDAAGGAAGATRSITVARHLSVSGSCVTQTCSVEQGCTTVCGAFGSQSGGVGPFKYARTAGSLPPSTSLKGLSLAGTFTAVNRYFFAVTVTDSLGASGSVTALFTVFQHIAFKGGLCKGDYSIGCYVTLPYSGGTPNGKVSAKITAIGQYCDYNGCYPNPGPPPAGYSLTAGGGSVIVSIPKGLLSGYVGTWTVVLTDSSPCSSGHNCSSAPATVTLYVLAG